MDIKEEKLKQVSERFNQACKNRLADKEALGYKGWDEKSKFNYIAQEMYCDSDTVYNLNNSFQECDPMLFIDIANRAMMLWNMSQPQPNPSHSHTEGMNVPESGFGNTKQ